MKGFLVLIKKVANVKLNILYSLRNGLCQKKGEPRYDRFVVG